MANKSGGIEQQNINSLCLEMEVYIHSIQSHQRGGMSQPTYLVTLLGEPKLCFGAEIIVFFRKILIFFNYEIL